jgi:hypothetical protein
MYNISDATYQIAKQMGLDIYPAEKEDKKLEVYDKKTGLFLFYVGDSRYMDYHMYLDYEKKQAGFGPLLHMTGDPTVDANAIKDFYRDIKGRFPEKFYLDGLVLDK